MSVNYTESQRAAIDNRGGALLVAAAAGSGKTKVLVERLLSRVTDPVAPVDIDRFLIITYTKAAAAELRSRILDEINERLADEPENRQLRRQLPLIYKAPISTIHSFCSSVLRENAQLLKISPDFRVMESDESDLLMQKALEDVLDSRYENPDTDFLLLIDTMAAGRDDSKLSPLVMEFYSKLKSHPYPEKWAREKISEMEESLKVLDVSETPWGRIMLEQAERTTDYYLGLIVKAVKSILSDAPMSAAYLDSFIETQSGLERLKSALKCGWDEARRALPIDFPKLKALRGGGDEAEEVKRIRDDCKKAMGKLCETFDSSSAELLEDIGAILPAVRALVSLTLDFDRACSDEKARRKTLDFGDLEHLSLSLLVDENGEPSEKARELSERYAEIMVDEYQDANEIQDILINSVSRGGQNVFMVGDVKQSIYRFRLADPTIFLRNYEAFKDASSAAPSEPRRILLQENFRSRQSVLDAVNFVFSNIMSKEFGEMDYGESECLKLGKKDFPEGADKAFELNLIEIPESEDEEAPDKTETEAAFVAERIRELISSGILISEKDGQRKLCYGDIAILLRSVKGKAERYAEALRLRNIPVSTESGGGFWEKTEICVMASLLAVLDNPRQDVALISVLRSPLFGFTPDELAEIRAADKENDFYTALLKASKTNESCASFIEFLNETRLSASDMPVDALIWRIYGETSAMSLFGAMSGGEERKNNLMALFDMARQFESAGYKGLYDFVTQLDKLMKRGGDVAAQPSKASGNAVTITSIHKSKGLEYPVVIIADTGKQFNRDDIRRPLLLHTELGAGPKRLDLKRRIEYPTLPRMAIAKRMTDEMLAEELRVLYVAMTRAREKLIVTCASKNTGRLLEKLSHAAIAPIAPQVLMGCASMGEWLLLAAMLRKEGSILRAGNPCTIDDSDDSLWDVRYIHPEIAAVQEAEETLPELPAESSPEAETEEIARALAFRYAHETAITLPSKLTATGIKGRFLDKEAAEEAEKLDKPKEKPAFERPNFARAETALTAPERGVALHLVMQYIDFNKCLDLDGINGEITRLARLKIISEKQALAVSPEKILKFFNSELGKEIREADALLREFKFSLLTPASDYFPDSEGEEILLQGVVDCCIEKDDRLTVIDFKTDYVTEDTQKERAESYRAQLETYAKAMERITGKVVARKLLYFFRTDAAEEL